MKRVVCLVAGFLMLVIGAGTAVGQTFMAGFGRAGASLFPRIPGLGSYDVAGTKLTASARAGYQWIGLNFNLPTSSPFGLGDGSAAIDIQLRDAHVWVGSVGLDAQLSTRLSFFVNGEANAKTTAGLVASDDPFLHLNGRGRHRWDASGLEWWAIEGGAAFKIFEGTAVFAGLKRDQLSFGLTDPRDQFGRPINFTVPFPGGLISGINSADFKLQLWVPYVGLRLLGNNHRVSVIWAPYVDASVKIPDNFGFDLSLPFASLLIGLEWRYSMFQTGGLLEGQLEYDVRLSPNFLINIWGKGSWLRVKGTGNLEKIRNLSLNSPLGIDIFDGRQGDRSATATLWRNMTAVGLAAKLEF